MKMLTVKWIPEKAVNMKTVWTRTKAFLVEIGWGLRPEKIKHLLVRL